MCHMYGSCSLCEASVCGCSLHPTFPPDVSFHNVPVYSTAPHAQCRHLRAYICICI